MRQRVGDGRLKELLRVNAERRLFGQQGVEAPKCVEKAIDVVGPRAGRNSVPGLLAADHAARPIEQIADVGEDLSRSSRLLRHAKTPETLRHVAQSLSPPIG